MDMDRPVLDGKSVNGHGRRDGDDEDRVAFERDFNTESALSII